MDNLEIRFPFEGKNLKSEDKEWCENLYRQYLISYPHLGQNLGNAQALQEVVWQDMMVERIKQAVEDKAKKNADGRNIISPTDKDYDSLRMARSQCLAMKKELGMFEDKKTNNFYDWLQTLHDKMQLWIDSHLDWYLCTSPVNAGEQFVMSRETKDYVPVKTPWIKDRIMNNPYVMDWYHKGRITKEEAAKAHGVNLRYIDWLDAKFYGVKIQEDGGTNFNAPQPPEQTPA